MDKVLILAVCLLGLLQSSAEAAPPQYGGRLRWDAGSLQTRKALRVRFQFEQINDIWYAINLGASLRLKFKLKGAAIKHGRKKLRRVVNGSNCLVLYDVTFKPASNWSFVRTALAYGFECDNGSEGWEGFAGRLPRLP